MKKYLIFLVLIVISLSFSGCSKLKEEPTASSDVENDIVSSSETSSEDADLISSFETDKVKVEDEKKPVESKKAVESTKPVETKKPVVSTKPVESRKPVESTKPVESKKAVKSTKPVESKTPVESTKPVESKTPVESTKPVEENDVSVLTSFTEGNVTIKLPNTLVKVMDSPLTFFHENFPQIADNFNLVIAEKDPEFNLLTKEYYNQELEVSLGTNVDITEFKYITISGYSTIKVKSSFISNGVPMKVLQYFVDGDKSYIFNFHLVNGNLKDYVNEIEASISIKK